ncbi:MAG: hypothetical protein EON60_08610 [Alphaproteobacteria bacterium]|nr:MAG: hypothetical protein EON60_08610 [Alphaproteobacteria bacterium]
MTRPSWFNPGRMITLPTDKSRGFCTPGLPLYVPGADTTVASTQAFLNRVDGYVAAHMPHADTHFAAEYPLSREAEIFPPHQIFGTPEWEYLLDFRQMTAPVGWVFKNVFDVGGSFGDSGVDPDKVTPLMTDVVERAFFDNLFQIGRGDPAEPASMEFGEHRDVFFEQLLLDGACVTLHMGDATDYCVRDALKYALRWKQVEHAVLLTDLTHGIYNTDIPGGVDSLDALIRSDNLLWQAFVNGRLVLVKSDEFLRHAA